MHAVSSLWTGAQFLKPLSVRTPTAVIGLIVAFAVAIAALSTILIWQGYRDALTRGKINAEIAAHAVAEHVQWIAEASRQTLQRIDHHLGLQPEVVSGREVADIGQAVSSLPVGVHVRVFDRNGQEVLSSDPTEDTIGIADRQYFQVLRDRREWEISPLIVDRAGKRQAFVIGLRLERDGEFAGIAVVLVPAAMLSGFWSALSLGPDSAISVVRDDGWLVARHPLPEQSMNIKDRALFTDYLPHASSGSFVLDQSATDGIGRLVGYRRVEGLPLIAIAAVSTEAALSDYKQWLFNLGLGSLPILMALVALAWWVAQLLSTEDHRRRELEQALVQNRMLFREVHHRVKNNLQNVASLIQLQQFSDGAKRDLRIRIRAMASVHDQIYRSESLSDIKLNEYLNRIAEDVATSFSSNAVIAFEGAEISLGSDQAMLVGLIATELLSNSFKYGFSDGHAGTIRIRLAHQDHGKVSLTISDNGIPFDPGQTTNGIGLKLIHSFAAQLNGTLAIEGQDGLHFHLVFPVQRD